MGLSSTMDKKYTPQKPKNDTCTCLSKDCMFMNKSTGSCSAEWCVFDLLPKMVTGGLELTCSVCKEKKITVSPYSGMTSYICPECNEKMKKITKDKKLCAVCGENEVEVDQYICTDCQKKIVNATSNRTCPICGSWISYTQSMCSTCASKIRGMINE